MDSSLVLALLGGLFLGVVHAATNALERLKHEGKARFASFAGGSGLAYVCLYLLFQITARGASEVQRTFPWGPDARELLFLVLLAALCLFYLLRAQSFGLQPRKIHRALVGKYTVYNLVVGAGLVEEAQEGLLGLLFYLAALGIHLVANDHFLKHEFPYWHRGRSRVALAAAPFVGCVLALVFHPPKGVLYLLLGALAGSTLINVIRNELPGPDTLRPAWFLAGAFAFALLIIGTWRF